ncbi:anhydro-N-acetylmuramic acid kinase [Gammaproteobacteria bacterium AH-315-M22]|nr:anhydro-N-acetylmuramic acid kinase [Gammaproteobacteria bacterium AH-315-M22]
MSGTSVDGIDAALINIDHGKPKLNCIATYSKPFAAPIRDEILAACAGRPSHANQVFELDQQLAQCYADAILQLLQGTKQTYADIAAIGNHGQTINHAPAATPPFSLQIGNAQRLADLTGIPVVSDFRSADLAVGGQGAPLAPAFHDYIFRNQTENRIVANLGGIANITILPKGSSAAVIGFDTGPANSLMDYWVEQHHGVRYDDNGEWAASGTVNQGLLMTILEDAYFQLAPPKSTGRELFNATWLRNALDQHNEIKAKDVQATLCQLTAITLANAIKRYAPDSKRLILCGGGTHNTMLVRQLQQHLPSLTIDSSDKFGVDPDYVEAIAFAWLADRHLNKLSGNLPSATGATKEVVLGRLTHPSKPEPIIRGALN